MPLSTPNTSTPPLNPSKRLWWTGWSNGFSPSKASHCSHGCRKLSLEVSHDNVGAQRLYRSLGFHDDHEDRDGDGTWSWYRHLH